MAAVGEHALGMKLHSLDGQRAMAQSHDDRCQPAVRLPAACAP